MPARTMEKHDDTAEKINQLLTQWGVQSVQVTNNSHLHVGHEGAKSGGGHFAVQVVADHFDGLNRIKRHRMVYQLLDALFANGAIHALEVEAKTPGEMS